jgi:hypothetical protein
MKYCHVLKYMYQISASKHKYTMTFIDKIHKTVFKIHSFLNFHKILNDLIKVKLRSNILFNRYNFQAM